MLALGNWGGGDADKDKLLTDVADDQVDALAAAFDALGRGASAPGDVARALRAQTARRALHVERPGDLRSFGDERARRDLGRGLG